jgi:hypothetical protein
VVEVSIDVDGSVSDEAAAAVVLSSAVENSEVSEGAAAGTAVVGTFAGDVVLSSALGVGVLGISVDGGSAVVVNGGTCVGEELTVGGMVGATVVVD